MYGRTDSPDRHQVDVPRALQTIFERVATRFEIFDLRHIYRATSGERLDVDNVTQMDLLEREYGLERSKVARCASKYNAAIEEYALDIAPAVEAQSDGLIQFATRKRFKVGSLVRAIEHVAGGRSSEKIAAQMVARRLRGTEPPRGEDAEALRNELGLADGTFAAAVSIYETAIAYYRSDPKHRQWNVGYRRRRQQEGMSLVLPAAFARRLPCIPFARESDERASSPISGEDIYGEINCSERLRPGTVALIAYILGIATHPKRFREYDAIDDEGRVYFSLGRAYQVGSVADPENDPGGNGRKSVWKWIEQLDRLELSATFPDAKGYHAKGLAPDLSIPSKGIGSLEKHVDCANYDEGTEWVSLDDERRPSSRVEYTLRATVDTWLTDRMGVAGDDDGDRVYLDPTVWRTCGPEGRAMYLVAQSEVAESEKSKSGHSAKFFSHDRWALRFGLDHLSQEKRKEVILAGFNQIYHADERFRRYRPPHQGGNNSDAFHFEFWVEGRSTPTRKARETIKRADFLNDLYAYEENDDAYWPGHSKPKRAKPPPRST